MSAPSSTPSSRPRPAGSPVAGRRSRSLDRAVEALRGLVAFAVQQALSCAFPVAVLVGLAVTSVVDVGIPRYDAMLVWCVAVQAAFVVGRLESRRELLVICAFHLLGLGLEVVKVAVGSWSYPDEGVLRVADVPLYSGFMYAAVGSYVCQAWRRLDLRVDRVRTGPALALAAAFYLNFLTNHWLPDVRWPLMAVAVLLLGRHRVAFTVRGRVRRMPLLVSFALIAVFIWLAENAATLVGAWAYASQADGWSIVHPSKIGSWTVLVVFSVVLVIWLHQRADDGAARVAASGDAATAEAEVGAEPSRREDGVEHEVRHLVLGPGQAADLLAPGAQHDDVGVVGAEAGRPADRVDDQQVAALAGQLPAPEVEQLLGRRGRLGREADDDLVGRA
ncbi:uncharacterized membrane protein YoaT (DUF817 family) [Frigoribacterium endophyticum]|nr:uncharacterized membrane protein YoaT (DUF817 family) [Frigoribacterium endophyticum]